MTAALAQLPGISLAAVVAGLDLQTRRDRKYLLPDGVLEELLPTVPARALTIAGARSFRYESRYFDTPTWASYLGAARRRPHRFKVRTRTYLDSGECMLEVKVRDRRGNTVKHRVPHPIAARHHLTADATRFVAGIPQARAHADQLDSALEVAYLRSTLVLDGADVRVTVDRDPTWSIDDAPPIRLAGLTLVETKTPGPASSLDRLLWRAGHRPVTISKYCTGLALLHPDLPDNKWHRVLQHHLRPTLQELDR